MPTGKPRGRGPKASPPLGPWAAGMLLHPCSHSPLPRIPHGQAGAGHAYTAPLWAQSVSARNLHACVLSLSRRVRLCDPKDCILPGPSVQGILQQENAWAAMPSSRGSFSPRD